MGIPDAVPQFFRVHIYKPGFASDAVNDEDVPEFPDSEWTKLRLIREGHQP